ncbi:DNA topoisomerase 1 [bioreactor metagenome]|uniref:DNA topoisomerase 1 n=1 Tax=bioreactor metagenome TaxID=1076179 RepID=A0A644WVR3_9ZZZZ
MESRLDEVEAGKEQWKKVLADFYGDFASDLKQAETDLDGKRIKVPDEVSDEVCDVCGKNLVVKSGRFGRFLACPGFPECTFTKPLVVEMPGRCPKCGGRILKKTSKKGYTYYGCEFNSDKGEKHCDFMTWDVPLKEDCPVCGQTLFKKSGRGYKKPFCANPECSAFLPEEKRGGYHKKAEGAEGETDKKEEQAAPKKTASKKASEKRPSAKKPLKKKASPKTASEKKVSAAKLSEASVEKRASAEKKPVRKPAAKKTAGKKSPAKKASAGKTVSSKKAVGKTALE